MIVQCPCQHCRLPIEFEPEQAGEFVTCPRPDCGQQTRLLLPGQTPGRGRPSDDSAERTTLENLRKKTCYGTLRSLIEFYFILGLGGAVIELVAAFVYFFTDGTSLGERGYVLIVSIVLFIFAIIIVVAAKQSSLLLVDLTDCQIAERTGKKQPEQ
jgi:hypothetical protein